MARPELTRKAIKEISKNLKGIFGINKPKNTTSKDVMDMLQLQISDDAGFSIKAKGVLFDHGGILEYPAEGVMVCGLGMSAKKKMKYFIQGAKKYNVTFKLGQATDTYDDLGIITEEKPYDHVNRLQVEETIKQFIGPIVLPGLPAKVLSMDGIQLANPKKNFEHRLVEVTTSNISCTHFSPPYVSLEVAFNHRFIMRAFVHELGKALGSCAHITSMERTLQGVFTSKDALPSYRWSWPCIQESIENMREKTENYIYQMKLTEKSDEEDEE